MYFFIILSVFLFLKIVVVSASGYAKRIEYYRCECEKCNVHSFVLSFLLLYVCRRCGRGPLEAFWVASTPLIVRRCTFPLPYLFLSAYARLVALNVVAQRVVYFNLTPHKRFRLAVLRVAVNSGSFIQAFSLAPCSALASVFLRVFLPRSA